MSEVRKSTGRMSPANLRTLASVMLMFGSAMVHVGLSLLGEVGHNVHGRVIELSDVLSKALPGLGLMLAAIWPISRLLRSQAGSERKRIITGFLAWTLLLLGTGALLSSAKGATAATQTFYWICLFAGFVAGLVWLFSKSPAASKPEGPADPP